MTDPSRRPLIYVVDDEESVLDALLILLQRKLSAKVRTFSGPHDALEAIQEDRPDLLITDIYMEGEEAGVGLLRAARERWPSLPVILISAVGSREAAIDAVNLGAFQFIEKPFENQHLLTVARSAIDQQIVREEPRPRGKQARSKRHNHPGSVGAVVPLGEAPAFMEAVHLVERAAASDVTVLFEGESGTGKGVLAAYLHQVSPRASAPFLSVNAGALPETLLESQLFGHVQGSFTGADKDQAGLVRAAEGGTLFLDEVAELYPTTQVKLLRVLQEREVIPVGGTDPHRVDVRFVAATHRNLRDEVQKGGFREDLFWRLNVMVIRIPPLRERPEDILLLADYALERLMKRSPDLAVHGISSAARAVLQDYSWPGNVRELENAIERAAVIAGESIEPDDLPPAVLAVGQPKPTIGAGDLLRTETPPLAEMERAYVHWVFHLNGKDVDRTAAVLQISAPSVRAILGPHQG